MKKILRRLTKRETFIKVFIFVAGSMLIATSVLTILASSL